MQLFICYLYFQETFLFGHLFKNTVILRIKSQKWRLTGVWGEGGKGRGDWMKEGEGISHRTYICIAHRCRQQCGNGQREEGVKGDGGRWAKGEKMGTSVIVQTIKIK